MDNDSKKAIYELSIFLPVVSILSIASVYYYELGCFQALGVPPDLIQVELTKNIPLIFCFISLMAIVGSIYFAFGMKVTPDMEQGKVRWDYKKTTIIFTLLGLLSIADAFSYLSIEIFPLLICLIAAVIILIVGFINNKREYVGHKFQILSSNIWSTGLLLMIISQLYLLFFLTGGIQFRSRKDFYVKPNGTTFLIRKYSNYSIYAVVSMEKKGIKEFIVSRSATDADTLIQIPVK